MTQGYFIVARYSMSFHRVHFQQKLKAYLNELNLHVYQFRIYLDSIMNLISLFGVTIQSYVTNEQCSFVAWFYSTLLFFLRKLFKMMLTCRFFAIRLTTRLTGINRSKTPTPARIDGPIASYKKYSEIKIVIGDDHKILM